MAGLSFSAYQAIKRDDFSELIKLIAMEGEERAKLFPNILSEKMNDCYQKVLNSYPKTGLKVCGAGGGGCFLLIHRPEDRTGIEKLILDSSMDLLNFKIAPPL